MILQPDNTADVVLLTVWHTGTKYFLEGLERHFDRATYSHLNAHWKQHKDGLIFTTYRNPLEVAASWANRGQLTKRRGHETWANQWRYYQELSEVNPVVLRLSNGREQQGIQFSDKIINSYEDKLGLHKALSEGNTRALFNYVPEELIAIAEECSEWAGGD